MDQEAIISYFVNPLTILRLVAWLCAVITFGALSANGSYEINYFAYSNSISVYCTDGALDYTITIGIFAFLLATFFLITSFLIQFTSMLVQFKKQLDYLEFGVGCFWSFLFFVAFCYTTNRWTSDNCSDLFDGAYANAARTGIAFSFFSMIVWGAIAGFLFKKIFSGAEPDDEEFKGAADPEPGSASDSEYPYAPFDNAEDTTPYTQYDEQSYPE